jgi:predicted aldo/keto reductase-like oxidoreductase
MAGTAGTMMLPQALSAAQPKLVRKTATDLVPLGRSNVKVCRLALGTGTFSGQVQRELGQEKFTALVRHAFERGVTFIDTADNYGGMHEMIRPAIQGVDREKIQIQCKIPKAKYDNPLKEIDRFRKEVGTDYFDSMLIHCVRSADWVEEHKRLRDLLLEAKEKQIVRSVGVSMHGLVPFNATVATDWGDVRFVRINHKGSHMDKLKERGREPGDVEAVVKGLKKMHADGKGIIGMKLMGEGSFEDPETRRKSIEFVMGLGCVDAVVIGFRSPAEIDEAIENINNALAA